MAYSAHSQIFTKFQHQKLLCRLTFGIMSSNNVEPQLSDQFATELL